KIGIVGRTGSGKSTLASALFRILESHTGSISIDGRNIATLGLAALRSGLQMIPQEPVLFHGTVRSNLDIRGKHSDDEIWRTLDLMGLKEYVSNLDSKLDHTITEGGENLSAGQRQLMCLGKSILARPKVLVMDEATAAVDAEADKRIQEAIREQFVGTTVISIAHRLNTIAGFDRVLVLDAGEVVEFDAPQVLLGNEGGVFREMVEATGGGNAEVIREIARKHYE
ncbi:Multidrug resistance-associated protein 1, partial [Quaeritorhiza haematococci]